MKKLHAVIAALIPFLVAAPVSAHHMAAGIVADDIYAMIDENLEGTPHLELDLTTIGTMTIVTVTVPDDDVSVAAVLDAVADARQGQGTQVESSLEVEVSPTDPDGMVTITIIEQIGRGESQIP